MTLDRCSSCGANALSNHLKFLCEVRWPLVSLEQKLLRLVAPRACSQSRFLRALFACPFPHDAAFVIIRSWAVLAAASSTWWEAASRTAEQRCTFWSLLRYTVIFLKIPTHIADAARTCPFPHHAALVVFRCWAIFALPVFS